MKVYTGIDLGSTTTKAVVMTCEDEILGRGITNSRSNYDVACALARGEAMTTARFALLRRRIEAEPSLAPRAADLVPDLELRFRREQHERQLDALREVCLVSSASMPGGAGDAGGPALREMLEQVFAGMRELAGAKCPFELPHASIAVRTCETGTVQFAAQEREPRVDQRLAKRHLAGHLVVAAAVGDAASEDGCVLSQHDGFRRRRTEIDPDGVVHTANCFCASIWKYDSSLFLMFAAEK